MINKRIASILIFLSLALVTLTNSCKDVSNTAQDNKGDTLRLRHSELLQIVRHEGYTEVIVKDAWHKDKVLHRYNLIAYTDSIPKDMPTGTVVRTPLKRSITFSSVHASLLHELGKTGSVCGICDCNYILSDTLKNLISSGKMTDMGQSLQPNIERIIASNADALLVSPFENNTYGPIEKLNIPIIECADYMETSPLGRAEWVILFGMLYDCEALADSMFKEIETSYNSWKEKAARTTSRPTLIVDKKTGPVWYMPGGRSTMGRLYEDAGCRYVFADLRESGSVSLNFETVFSKASDADLWLMKYGSPKDLTYRSLLTDDKRYAEFKAFKTRHIYGCNTLNVAFFEETPFHPERVLKEVVAIAHPELGFDKYRYFKALKE
ncbi:ABC transporter substrate-binding protein [Pseudoprevotella muciniphila]|uniref:ABC transporter substrate-binding protein n=1 Tax=Pseudoprevotella muciniphila TaxID=2133944 RepID=A0A5P8E982_9BACT|nr:ABC transporter substrate-binding protein [Pseudoprevotella muciniphila]QFQ13457.1 ABC transporter substrate-binding protein [Pseudoprevotella muciniphila]